MSLSRHWPRLMLAAVTLWSFAFTAAALVPWFDLDGIWAGDGRTSQDLWQYMSWARESGDHFLIANRFDLAPYDPVFLHPVFLLSGVLWKLGLPIQLAYLVWKPVAIAALVLACVRFARRHLPTVNQQIAGAVLAIFMYTPIQALTELRDSADDARNVGIDQLQSNLLLGPHTAGSLPLVLSVAAMPFFLLGAERLVREGARGHAGLVAATAFAGMAASWCHPWQGLTLLAIVGATWAWERFDRSWLVLAVPVAATAVPIAYYGLLGRYSDAFQIVGERQLQQPGVRLTLVTLAPMIIAAWAALRLRPQKGAVGERLLFIWPLVCLALYFGLGTDDYSLHALNGITVPLGILAVRAWAIRAERRPGRARLTAVLGLIFLLGSVPIYTIRTMQRAAGNEFRSADTAGVDRALEWLEARPGPGGVFADLKTGAPVPAMTGRPTWVGHQAWTPGFLERDRVARRVLGGAYGDAEARRAIERTGARFVLGNCTHDLRPALGDSVVASRQFDCTVVIELAR